VTTATSRVVRLRHRDGRVRSQVVRLPCGVRVHDGALSFVRDREADTVWLTDNDGTLEASPPREDPRTVTVSEPLRIGEWLLSPLESARADEATIRSSGPPAPRSPAPRTDATVLSLDGPGGLLSSANAAPSNPGFPPPCFAAAVVPMADLRVSGHPLVESTFLALGGGLGSFVWVDLLRVCGVPTDEITSIGFESVPYARYRRLCQHSQIPPHERLRSNSESCPDNIWGFPGYGLREALDHIKHGRFLAGLGLLGQLTGEPDRAETYTPRADQVFDSIDVEASRIGWSRMVVPGRIRSLRKTDDGRYVAAVSTRNPDGTSGRALHVAPFVQVALGYPGVQFLDDLRAWREQTADFERVVNAYEDHEHVYRSLAEDGGVVVLRGRGIVASRILQKLAEVRRAGTDVRVVHLMRGRKDEGGRAGKAQRRVQNHWEFQPFNWPEACWGGDLATELEKAERGRRAELLAAWGGTTTADREDWREIVAAGLAEGWYSIRFGGLTSLQDEGGRLRLVADENGATSTLAADFIVDATGLISSIHGNPVLADLVQRYSLPLNPQGRLDVTPDFELEALRNGNGRAFAVGVSTLGGPYAPVDSFLGLQYAAVRICESLRGPARVPSGLASARAWWRWVRGVAP